MADVFTQKPGRVAGVACRLGHAKITFVATAVTYATATGGLPVDFFAPFTEMGINPADVIDITGYSTLGHLAIFTKGTMTSTTYPWTVRLWEENTAPAEIGDGAITKTIHCNVFFYPGSKA
jgi:hypothetical protein